MTVRRHPAGPKAAPPHQSEVHADRAIGVVRLLHLEDDARDAALVQHALEAGDITCRIVRAGSREVFEAALTDHRFDLVICDFKIPRFDGLAALRLTKERAPDTPVIIVSGAMDPTEAVQCLKEGAADYVLKDRLERIPSAVARALTEGRQRQRQRETEARLLESELRFRQLAEQSREGFWFAALNPERMLYVNSAMEAIWTLPAEAFYRDSRVWLGAIHDDDRARLRHGWDEWIRSERRQFEEEYRIVRPDGSVRWILHTGTRIEPDSGTDVRHSGLIHDVTERKLLEGRLTEAQRLESVGRLAGGIAHDFNNLLTVINGVTDLVMTGLAETDPLRADLGEVLQAGERAAVMTHQLLAFSRKQVLQPRVLSLPAIVTRMEPLLRRVLGERITLVVTMPERLGNVKADPNQLELVLVNLAVHGRDAMPQGGVLTIDARSAHSAETDFPSELALPLGWYVMLAVSDTGVGVDEVTRKRLFEPFSETAEMEAGKGLGLSMVHGVVLQSGGEISVESEIGRGTTFRLYLPEVSEPAEEVPGPSAPSAPRGQTVLLVDDNEGLRKLAQRMLVSAGYTVLAVANGAEALRLLKESTQLVHLLLTDVVMPGMHGDELAQQARLIRPDIRVLYATGFAQSTLLSRGVLHRSESFVSKPFTAGELTLKVQHILNR